VGGWVRDGWWGYVSRWLLCGVGLWFGVGLLYYTYQSTTSPPPPPTHTHSCPRTHHTPPGPQFDASPLAASLHRLRLTHAALARGQRPPSAAWGEIANDLMVTGLAVQSAQQAADRAGVGAQRASADAFLGWLAEVEGGRVGEGGGAAV